MTNIIGLSTVIAHRGASAYVPENTILAMQKARELGASMVEFDVTLSKDKVPIIIHDDKLNRTTNGKGYCYAHSLKELKQLDAGRWFSKKFADLRIPTLAETLSALLELGLSANIELKTAHDSPDGFAAIVLAKVNEYWTDSMDKLIFSSFDERVLKALRSFSPDIHLGLLLHEWTDDWEGKAEAYQCVSLHINQRVLSEKRIQAIKSKDYLLLSYVVNRRRKAQKLLKYGVDAIFSDYPDLLP